MHKVLLADDEPSITESMKNTIPWSNYDMEVAHIVSSGHDAYNLIKDNDIDLAILDIRMPGYSGLDISKMIFTNNLKTKVIIVSGYAEFSYAQKAITYDVLGYLLKPVEYEELEILLLRAQRMLSSDDSSDLSADFMNYIEEKNTSMMEAYLKDQGLSSDQYYIASTYGNVASPVSHGISFSIGISQNMYISNKPYIEKDFDGITYAGIGLFPASVSITSLRHAIYECASMCFNSFMNNDTSQDSIVCTSYTNIQKTGIYKSITSANSFNEKDKLIILLNNLKEPKYRSQMNINSTMKLNNLLVSNNQLFPNGQDYYIYNYKQLLHDYSSFDNLIDSLIFHLSNASETIDDDNSFSNTYFLKIMKYINTYYNENLSLKDVAAVVNLNPNYVSQLFKKCSGSTFSHYLTNLRISNAKKLITTTNTSINEIASQTGFNDYFYFLKTFKKFTGKTPSEYRANQD
ncbi:MAG: response regulator [Butyrivibrio sp.]|uniref:response regulator transcription factor n=1 Tax=Butyrivibrio sp. TaxID=28121 RepID=UPI0025CE8996|nr:response regulator [Butyrivibrio sp.]MCR5770072.1 response regulator [Butyrivibrio sp.]